ncbi:hypothetical protein CHK_1786 [Christensenella hongkongensis]|uniref:Uncharacterized protein n=1 Tax=Christensenella hongkongensis TaxID=270498 RepID=A0A0M2NI84_9FIRM|nr:hypothetical protein CHK_1786 [Christensenella hongkongensis]
MNSAAKNTSINNKRKERLKSYEKEKNDYIHCFCDHIFDVVLCRMR